MFKNVKKIEQHLFELQDKKYKEFHKGLVPNIDEESIIGVRVPVLRNYAKSLMKESYVQEFLDNLPHKYNDENQLHSLLLSDIKDFDVCVKEVERFLPYVNNWSVCDILSPKCFRKNKEKLLPYLCSWIKGKEEYMVRFAIVMFMQHFLGENFKAEYLQQVINVKREEYYIKMAQSWYIATALAKNYEQVVGVLEQKRLEKWTHNKSIQKAVESFRIKPEQKTYLRTLKIK